MHPTLIRTAWLACGLLLAAGAHAQSAPSADQMIEQLKAPPRTRSLRNLTVEAAPPAGTPAAGADAAGAATASSAGTQGGSAGAAAAAAVAVRPSLSLQIQFDFNSARVRPESQQALANLAQALQSPQLAQSRFAVEGHTDAKGGADYNLRLSQQRAEAVRDYLNSRGVQGTRLVASGKGSSDPANGADPFAAENRRVRIVNLD